MRPDPEIAEGEVIAKMKWLYSAQPEKDFLAAIKDKDYRFFGLYGVGLHVPRVSLKCLSIDKDVRPIVGTSDAILGYEHHKLVAIASVYADDFNSRMRRFREENMRFKCES